MLKIPYTSCGAFSSALTFNKHATKLYLKEYGILMANALLIRKDESFSEEAALEKAGLPCFVKPNDSGSSYGVSKVKKKEEFHKALEAAFRESNEVLIESFMNGREMGCGVVKTKSKNEFFDYEAKYSGGKSEEITPAQISQELTEKIQSLSSEISSLLGCRGIVRVDFIVVNGNPFFLEINTVPGMTKESLIPQQAAAASIPLKELYSMVVEDLFL
jgi:D-alanine-D-alanine ligase